MSHCAAVRCDSVQSLFAWPHHVTFVKFVSFETCISRMYALLQHVSRPFLVRSCGVPMVESNAAGSNVLWFGFCSFVHLH